MFPADFSWGSPISSTQWEGAAPRSDWAGWEQAGRAPESRDGNGFVARFAEDFALMASAGMTDVQLNLSWARIELAAGRIDGSEVERYRLMLDAGKRAGLRVWACLLHGTIPGWFEDTGGFGDDHSSGYAWTRWVDECAQAFGDLVHGWVPMHEASRLAINGWLTGTLPPGRRDGAVFGRVVSQLTVAHRDARRQLRGAGQPILQSVGASPVFAANDSPNARRAKVLLDEAIFGSLVSGYRDGLMVRPGQASVPLDDLAGSADVVALNCGAAIAVDEEMGVVRYPADAPVDAHGRSIWPAAVSRVVERVADELPAVPLVIGGIGVSTTDESLRLRVLHEQLSRVESLIDDGVAIVGVSFAALIDCYGWGAGWSGPTGLYNRDREPRVAAEFIADVMEHRTVPADLEPYLERIREQS